MRPAFTEAELEVKGYYDSPIPNRPSAPVLNSPVTARENLLMALSGEKPWWFPAVSMAGGDDKPLRPRGLPDLMVAHDVMDGEPPVDWSQYPEHMEGWFDTIWQYEPNIGGSMVVPNSQKIDDMNDWVKLPWPNLDDFDWQRSAEANKAYIGGGLATEFCIPTSYWERLMAILKVDDAAVALVDSDQQGAVHAFFEKLTDFYIEYVGRARKYYNADIILMHDDWGHQNAPIFSYKTCEEMIIPHFKRLITAVHDLGMRFEQHCCGKAESFAPLMLEAGVNLWCPQTMNDYKQLAKDFKGTTLMFGVTLDVVVDDMPDELIQAKAEEFVATYADTPVAYLNYGFSMKFYKAVYELSRKALA
jgi:hypothetical protein